MGSLRSFLSFPNPVNDYAARVVAGIVVALSLAYVVTGDGWLLLPLAYGFWARVLSGPKVSPAGLFATRAAAPWLEDRFGPARLVAGPPKRFAQAMGTAFSSTALLLHFGAGLNTAARAVAGLLAGAALLESGFGFCLGCEAFSFLMRVGVIPESACSDCADLGDKLARTASNP